VTRNLRQACEQDLSALQTKSEVDVDALLRDGRKQIAEAQSAVERARQRELVAMAAVEDATAVRRQGERALEAARAETARREKQLCSAQHQAALDRQERLANDLESEWIAYAKRLRSEGVTA